MKHQGIAAAFLLPMAPVRGKYASQADEYDSEEGSTEESGSEAPGGKDSDSDSSTEAPLLRDVEESET